MLIRPYLLGFDSYSQCVGPDYWYVPMSTCMFTANSIEVDIKNSQIGKCAICMSVKK